MLGCRVWVRPAFRLGANLDTKVWPDAFYHHLRIELRTLLPCKGTACSPLYVSVELEESRVGREIISKVFVGVWLPCLSSHVVSSWRQFRHQYLAVFLLPSSSNRITTAVDVKGHTQFAFVRTSSYQSSEKRDDFQGFRMCLVGVYGFAVAFFFLQI